MRPQFVSLLVLLLSCSTPLKVRGPASEIALSLGAPDFRQSLVQIFPAHGNNEFAYYFYVQLKDVRGNFVDVRQSDFKLKTTTGVRLEFEFERLQVGKYYLSVPRKLSPESHQMDLFIRGKALRDQLKISMRRPHQKHTSLKLVRNHGNRMTLELRLADQKNKPVETPEAPEILLEGQGTIENLDRVKEGIWHFTVHYPDENQILYLGVRTMGITFQNLYRYQHVEK